MSETTTEVTKVTETEATADPKQTQGEPAGLGEGGKKALEAERQARKAAEKATSDLQAQLDKIQRANETELEKAQREANEAKAAVEKLPSLVADQLRDHLAEIHDISAEQRELYLTSNDPSVLLKQAMGLVERTSSGPKPDLTQGGRASTPVALNSNGLEDALKNKLGIR